jgi:hypothetical protein
MGPESCARREHDRNPAEDFSWDRLRHLTSNELIQSAARRISDYNARREGGAAEPLRFGPSMPTIRMGQSSSAHHTDPHVERPVPWCAVPAGSDPYFYEFIDQLLTSQLSPSILSDAFRRFPTLGGAVVISMSLILGGRLDREMALDIFFELVKSDNEPGSAVAHLWMIIAICEMLTDAPDSERRHWIQRSGDLLRAGSEPFVKGFQFNLHEYSHDSDRESREAQGRIDALLGSKLPQAYCGVLACATSSIVSSKVKTYAFTQVLNNPFPGTPGLNEFVRSCWEECEPEARRKRLMIVAGTGGFVTEYWGPLGLFALERPLRLAAAKGHDLLKMYGDTCKKLSPSTFLFAYHLADGDPAIVSCLDRILWVEGLSTGEFKWMSRHLKQSLIRASFLSPFQQLQCQHDIRTINSTNDAGRKKLLNLLNNATLQQCENLPYMVAYRLMAFSGADVKEQRVVLSALPERMSPDGASPQVQSYLRVDPSLTAQQQVRALTIEHLDSKAVLEDTEWYSTHVNLSEDNHRRWFCASPTAPSSLRQYVRAQTLHADHAPQVLAVLNEAFQQTIPKGELKRWLEWRYEPENPLVARQLRSLSPQAREAWANSTYCIIEGEPVGGAVPLPHLQGRSQYLVMTIDDPLWLFNLGVLPRVSSACTAFDGGAYYARNAVSYVVDAHIQGMIVFDFGKILGELAPHMSQNFRDELEAENLSNRLLRAEFHRLATAVVARSVIKLVEDREGNPILMMEPTFVNNFHDKKDPTPELLTFAQVLARKYCAGISVAPYADELRFPMAAVVMPPSRSPGGQIENHDLMPWFGSHHGATEINAIQLLPPPQRGVDHPFWRGIF